MTFDKWWDSTNTSANPMTYKGWEETCRQAWVAGAKAERERIAKECAGMASLAWAASELPSEEASREMNEAAAIAYEGVALELRAIDDVPDFTQPR